MEDRSAGDSSAEWDQMDIKAVNYIYSAINNKKLEYIGELDTAYEIIKKFDRIYLEESTALQIVCRNNVEAIKLKNYTDVTIFFDEFGKAVNDLKAAGAKLTENEKLNYMLKALPGSYSYIDVLPERERTVEYLKSKIKLKSVEVKKEEEKSDEIQANSNAYTVVGSSTKSNKQPVTCYNCGKTGSTKRKSLSKQ